MSRIVRWSSLLAVLGLGACVSMPSGPSMLVLPGSGKSFDQFRADDMACRQYAQGQVGGATGGQVAADSGIRSAALGTALGAVAGAAIGDSGHGAAVGAGTGLLLGSASGAQAGNVSAYGLQQRYDYGYVQCMYAQGHRVPVAGRFTNESRASPGYSSPSSPGYSAPSSPSYSAPSSPGYSGPPPNYAVPPPNTPPPSGMTPYR